MSGEGYEQFPPEAMNGTEFGGAPAEDRWNTLQPRRGDDYSTAEQLRSGYTTGEDDWRALEDRRQMMGLRPADGAHPRWLVNVSPTGDHRLDSEAQIEGLTDQP